MLKNYFKIAIRNLQKYKVDSFISLSGLAVGLCCCMILIMYVRFEWSYDNFHENADSIYRLTEQTIDSRSGDIRKSTIHPYVQSVALEQELPEIESIINVAGVGSEVLLNGKYLKEQMLTVSPEFLTHFTFPLIYGNSETALQSISNIVITESKAIKYFGKTNVLGETLTVRLLEDPIDFIITGVAKDVPTNSSIQFEFLLPFENIFLSSPPDQASTQKENWYIGFLESWITLKNGTSKEAMVAKFPAFLERHYGSNWIERNKIVYGLQPLSDVYFDENFQSGYTQSTNKTYSLILGGIAFVILLIAGINFMSLTLSRITTRSHEIGIRKTVGAVGHQVKIQIIVEVFISCFIAILIGVVLAEILAPYSGFLFNKELDLSLISDPLLWLSILGLLLILTVVTSLYPAIKISLQNTTSLFSSNTASQKMPVLIKGLIVVQFGLAITFMIGTYIMQNQIDFMLNKDLGYNPNNVIAIQINSELENGMELGKLYSEEASKISGIGSTSITAGVYRDYSDWGLNDIGMAHMMSSTHLKQLGDGISSESVDENYLETMGIKIVMGSNFSKVANSYSKDEIIVNKAFSDAMGWDNPIGQILDDNPENQSWVGSFDGSKVIGVIENYNFRSLYDPLKPIVLQHIEVRNRNPGTILVRINSSNVSGTISQLEVLWGTIAPEEIFSFSFLDNMVQNQYNEEIRWSWIIRVSSVISILLACFGLFGLSSLVVQRRIKEIGIRKVFGASIENIVVLVSKDFILLVIVGFSIATPVAWYLSSQWLTSFSYKTDLGMIPFLLGGCTALLIAFFTVSWQSIKAAQLNPIDNLKTE